jgi:hypothetical protein
LQEKKEIGFRLKKEHPLTGIAILRAENQALELINVNPAENQSEPIIFVI